MKGENVKGEGKKRGGGPLRVGIGGPVGSGKTALTLALCRSLRERYQLAVVTNDIYTEEDAKFLVMQDRKSVV